MAEVGISRHFRRFRRRAAGCIIEGVGTGAAGTRPAQARGSGVGARDGLVTTAGWRDMWLAREVRRRARAWWLAVPILLVTMVGGYYATHPAPRFRAQAVVQVEAPAAEQAKADNPNPYADQKASLAATAALIAQGLSSDSSAAHLHAEGMSAGYSLTPRNSGTTQEPYYWLPRLDITADGPSLPAAGASLRILLGALNADLDDLQNRVGVDAGDRVRTQLLVSPSTTVVPVRKTRALAGVLLIGGGAAALIPGWARREAARRRARGLGAPPAITAGANAGGRARAGVKAGVAGGVTGGIAELAAGDTVMGDTAAGDDVIEASDWY